MDGFERRKTRTREGILRVALELFREYGFKKVSIGDIARKANVSPVTIYNRFGSKETLVREVVKYLSLSILDKYRAIVKEQKPFLEKLQAIVFDKSELASNQFRGELMSTVASNEPGFQDFYKSIWENGATQLMGDLYEEGKKQGFISEEISREAILTFVEILRYGISHTPGLPTRLEHNPKLARELVSLFAYGLNG